MPKAEVIDLTPLFRAVEMKRCMGRAVLEHDPLPTPALRRIENAFPRIVAEARERALTQPEPIDSTAGIGERFMRDLVQGLHHAGMLRACPAERRGRPSPRHR